MTEDEMVGWHHQLNGHEFKKASGEDEQQGSLAFSSPWSCKESVTEQQQQNYLFCGQMKQVPKVLSTVSGLWCIFSKCSFQFLSSPVVHMLFLG